jgi:hypothetical protein
MRARSAIALWGEGLIWLEERRLDKLNSFRRSGESYSEGDYQAGGAVGRTSDTQAIR